MPSKPPKTRVIKAEVRKAKVKRRKSKGHIAWEVWSVGDTCKYYYQACFQRKKEAQNYIEQHELVAAVIVYIEIPAMEY